MSGCKRSKTSTTASTKFSVRMPTTSLSNVLRILVEHGVEFIVAGDVASALQGGPLNAIGIAAVYARTELNRPDETHLLTSSHQPLLTRFGPLRSEEHTSELQS